MSADGVFAVPLATTGDYVINDPVLQAHGCVFGDGVSEGELRAVVQRAVSGFNYDNGNKDELAAVVRKALKSYFYKTVKQAPLIIVSILDV